MRSLGALGYVGVGTGGLLLGLLIGTLLARGADPVWLESIGTLAAAVVAAGAAVSALHIARRDRENATAQAQTDRQHATAQAHADRQHGTRLSVIAELEGRYRDLQELLLSFDRYVGARWIGVLTEAESQAAWRAEGADFSGRLRASTEKLPRARQLMFSHFQPTEEELDAWLADYVEDRGPVGDPEVEPQGVMVVRGEILTQRDLVLADIAAQRAQLNPGAPAG